VSAVEIRCRQCNRLMATITEVAGDATTVTVPWCAAHMDAPRPGQDPAEWARQRLGGPIGASPDLLLYAEGKELAAGAIRWALRSATRQGRTLVFRV
jgi:hypothetical protein